jgi:hypothetical protein
MQLPWWGFNKEPWGAAGSGPCDASLSFYRMCHFVIFVIPWVLVVIAAGGTDAAFGDHLG